MLGQGAFNAGWHAHAPTRPCEFLVSRLKHAKPERARAHLIDDADGHGREHGKARPPAPTA